MAPGSSILEAPLPQEVINQINEEKGNIRVFYNNLNKKLEFLGGSIGKIDKTKKFQRLLDNHILEIFDQAVELCRSESEESLSKDKAGEKGVVKTRNKIPGYDKFEEGLDGVIKGLLLLRDNFVNKDSTMVGLELERQFNLFKDGLYIGGIRDFVEGM